MSPSSAYRPDIDGLRAVAVLGVLFFHAGLGFSGGYVGVDVFFVISGFLITGLILKEQTSGNFSLATFWERRIRRILPALALVVGCTLAVGLATLFPSELVGLVKSAMAQLVLGSNVYFWQNAGYFDPPAELQPLLHTWSLAIEEQFYLGFPLLLMACKRVSRPQLQLILGSVLAASFALSVWGTYAHPTATFYLLPSRAWELLVGAWLAAAAAKRPLRNWVAEGASCLGLGAIVFAFFSYGATTRFPGVNAALPCVGTALLIWSNSGERTAIGRLLSRRSIVFIGLISYSLYLWHWPILAFIRYRVSDNPALDLRIGAIAASFVLAVLSWRFIETPFRHRSDNSQRSVVFASALATTAGLFLISALIWRMHGIPQRFPDEILRFAEENEFPSEYETTRIEQIEQDQLPVVGRPDGSEPSFLLWGDSHAPPVAAALEKVAERHGVWGYVAANSGITPVLGTWRPKAGKEAVSRNQAVLDFVRRKRIRTVILASDWRVNTLGRENGALDSLIVDDENHGVSQSNSTDVLERGLLRTANELKRAGANVWVMRQVPIQRELPTQQAFDAWLGRGTLSEFGITLDEHERLRAQLNPIFGELALRTVHVLDPTEVCFNSSGKSFISANGRSYYWDRTHLTTFGARHLLPRLLEPVFEQVTNTTESAESAPAKVPIGN
jgi:peptidoglycan/LPS O-acetylase OafA/YrhL